MLIDKEVGCEKWVKKNAPLVGLRWGFQSVYHVRNDNQLFEFHSKVVSGGGAFFCPHPGLRLPCLMPPSPRLSSLLWPRVPSWAEEESDRVNASTLFCDLFFYDYVGHNSLADLVERLWAIPY